MLDVDVNKVHIGHVMGREMWIAEEWCMTVVACPHCHTTGSVDAKGECLFCHRDVNLTYDTPVTPRKVFSVHG